MRVFLLCGSIAKKSHTRALLQYLEGLFKEKGCETIFWDLKAQPLPIAIPEYHKDPSQNPDLAVQKFVREVAKSDVVILGSALYHGSYTGVLKNALDNLAGDGLHGKWIGLAGNAGSLRASHVEFSHLRQVVNTMEGYTAQTQVGTCGDDYADADGQYTLTSEKLQQRCLRLVDEILSLV